MIASCSKGTSYTAGCGKVCRNQGNIFLRFASRDQERVRPSTSTAVTGYLFPDKEFEVEGEKYKSRLRICTGEGKRELKPSLSDFCPLGHSGVLDGL